MDRQEFIKSFTTAPDVLAEEKTNEVIEACIKRLNTLYSDFPEGYFNCTSAMEELAELTAAISQCMRGRADKYDVLQEIGDVILSILCISKVFGITKEDICRAINVKLKREYRKQKYGEDNSYIGKG